MIVAQPACIDCRHYRPDRPVTCAAFPDRIPDLVWLKGDPHTGPIPGDHGIQFELRVEPKPDPRV